MPELIEHQTITAIVENVALALADIEKGFALLSGAKNRLGGVLGHDSYYDSVIDSQLSNYNLDKASENSAKLVTRNAWKYILAQTGLNQYMTAKRRKELEEQIEKNELPPLTVENIVGTLQGLAGKVNGLLEESIKEVFDWLRPRHKWGTGALKTNCKFRVGPKVIIGWAVERGYGGTRFHINYHRDGDFRALGNVFSLLDGKGVLKYPHDLHAVQRNGSAGRHVRR